jgi:hypothetical protein
VNRLRLIHQAIVSERGGVVVKYALVVSLCVLMAVAVVDARAGRFSAGPAAFTAAPR